MQNEAWKKWKCNGRSITLGWNEADSWPWEMLLPYVLEISRCISNQHSQGQITREKRTQSTFWLGLEGDSTTLRERDSGCGLGGKKPGNPTLHKHRSCCSDSSLLGCGKHGVTELSHESQQQGLSTALVSWEDWICIRRGISETIILFHTNPCLCIRKTQEFSELLSILRVNLTNTTVLRWSQLRW